MAPGSGWCHYAPLRKLLESNPFTPPLPKCLLYASSCYAICDVMVVLTSQALYLSISRLFSVNKVNHGVFVDELYIAMIAKMDTAEQ